MKWYEVRLRTNREACDAVSDMLMSIGANGVAVDDVMDIIDGIAGTGKTDCIYDYDYIEEEILRKAAADDGTVTIKGYFPARENIDCLIKIIEDKISDISKHIDTGKMEVGYFELCEEDWANNWKSYYKPFNITENIVIKPSWEEYTGNMHKIIIEMDPGMAFGTGTHETTRMCVLLLEKYVKNGDTVIDVGSGSGILSIIAAKLGAKSVLALDIDEEAVRVTENNCKVNNVEGMVKVLKGSLDYIGSEVQYLEDGDAQCFQYLGNGKADLVVANIIADVIINLAWTVRLYVKEGGLFIASGIIKDKKDSVLSEYLKNGFQYKEIIEEGEWVAIVFRCPGSL
ncbi:MAG: 50S ribosomal protein L11 methyltransferase [Firmicutes bacterium]|nr:50S ribosomal protein L11 methyltransferase [Bacillota bacterium]